MQFFDCFLVSVTFNNNNNNNNNNKNNNNNNTVLYSAFNSCKGYRGAGGFRLRQFFLSSVINCASHSLKRMTVIV